MTIKGALVAQALMDEASWSRRVGGFEQPPMGALPLSGMVCAALLRLRCPGTGHDKNESYQEDLPVDLSATHGATLTVKR